jgi:hypothetical protein
MQRHKTKSDDKDKHQRQRRTTTHRKTPKDKDKDTRQRQRRVVLRVEARLLCVGWSLIIMGVDDFQRNDLILIMIPPDFQWVWTIFNAIISF